MALLLHYLVVSMCSLRYLPGKIKVPVLRFSLMVRDRDQLVVKVLLVKAIPLSSLALVF
jgi:hypothetical protein